MDIKKEYLQEYGELQLQRESCVAMAREIDRKMAELRQKMTEDKNAGAKTVNGDEG